MGAFAAIAKQRRLCKLRAFGGKDSGANVGVFLRRVDGETLYSAINTFADYGTACASWFGGFLRLAFGGEYATDNPFSALAKNYYLPITDDKRRVQMWHFRHPPHDANLRQGWA